MNATIRVVPEVAEANGRLAAVRLTMLTLRCMENWRRGVSDYDSAMVLVAVAAISSERLTRTVLEEEYRGLDQPIPSERLAKCNVSSIAAATGLNRETARRKVNDLVERGFLVRSDAGVIGFRPGLLQEATTWELVRKQLDAVARLSNDLLRDGAFTLTDQLSSSVSRLQTSYDRR